MNQASVRVPATTANLGPGFDCLGVALQIYNTTTVRRGRGKDPGDMANEAADTFFHEVGGKPFGFSWSVSGDVPRSRGLGSSVTVRLGVLHGLNELAGRPLDKHRIFRICAGLEGHPDNAAPAAFGGFTVVPPTGTPQRFPVKKSLQFILLIPGFEISTPAARKALPSNISLADAVLSVGNAAAVAAAFASGEYAKLAGCFGDRLHQPYREKLLPCLSAVIAAAESARRPEKIARAMLAAAGLPGAAVVAVAADNSGVRILK